MSETAEFFKLAPDPVVKPWGLRHRELLDATGIAVGVGELWLASAQTGPGNYASRVVEPPLNVPLADVLEQAAAGGEAAMRRLVGDRSQAVLRSVPHRGKTEAWIVREARGRVGFVTGPRTPDQRDRLKELLRHNAVGADAQSWTPQVRELLGVLEPVRAGEVFLVPCGTLHTMFASGEDSRLVIDEIQQGYGASRLPTLSKILLVQDSLLSVQVHPCDQTVQRVVEGRLRSSQDLEANPTVRVTDFGRRPGEDLELGFDLVRLDDGLRRVTPVQVDLQQGGRLAVLVACRHFVKFRLALPDGAVVGPAPLHGGYRVLHCVGGAALLEAGDRRRRIAAGETVFVPAALEAKLSLTARGDCEVLCDAVPDLAALKEFLADSEVSGSRVEALFNPPRAL